jgi:hypothetical protein
MTNNDRHYGTVEIELPNGEYFVTEVVRDGDKFITGTCTNTGLLRDKWEVNISDYAHEQEALEELYAELEDYAASPEAIEAYGKL